MIYHDFAQGSPEWHQHRATHFNASDAPAMLGCSPYMTRTELLTRMKTGISQDVAQATQKRFDDGHRFEALARPLAEKIIGDELYPVVGSMEEYSASFDGLTLDNATAFEHKTLNDELRAAFADMETIAPEFRESSSGKSLPLQYRVQMEQQLMVAGAEKCLFMASKWNGETLVEERHCWYMADKKLRAEIGQGWIQFKKDLANHAPIAAEVKPVAAPQMGLPAVSIQVNGSIALVDNLQAFGTALTAYVERINKEPETDQDFADLEATVKTLKNAEEALDAAENGALAQTESIDSMRRTVGLYRETARTNRLLVEKLVKVEKENRRTKIIGDAGTAFASHMNGLNARLGKAYMPQIHSDFNGVVKGLKSIDSMRDKVAGELARCKIEANAKADLIQANLTTLREQASAYTFLFADTAQLVQKEPEFVAMAIKNRIADHQAAEAAKEAATRERIRAEEQAKAEKAVREAQEAEDTLVSSFERSARRIEHDSVPYIEKALTAYKSIAKDWADDPRPRIAAAYAAGLQYLLGQLDAAQQREAAAKSSADAIAKAQTVDAAKPVTVITAVPEANFQIVTAVAARVAPKQTTPPSMSLGEISTRLGFNVTSAFLASLGFEATTVKAAKLFHPYDFPDICNAIIKHVESVAEAA